MSVLEEKARFVAKALHINQKYSDTKDYYYHLEKVVSVLKRFGIVDEAILSSAWLHDSVEDQKLKFSFIEEEFSKEVMDIVYRVTNELGVSRKEINSKTYPKISQNIKAILVKLADRIANIEENNESMRLMYKKEHSEFIYYDR